MDNKTDKPYSLQDAKDEVSKKYGYTDWQYMYIQDNRPLNYHRVSGYDKKNKLFNDVQSLIQKSEGDLLKVIIDKSKELDAEQKSHTVTNTDQLRISAMGKSEGDVNKKI